MTEIPSQLTSRPLVKIDIGIEWRTSPLLPVESMAARQYSLLEILAAAQAEQLPMAPLVRSFSYEHRRRFRRRLQKLAKHLTTSTDLASALRKTPNVLPDSTITAIELGTATDSLNSTFEQLLTTERPTDDDLLEKWYSVLGYALFVLPTSGAVTTGYCIFVAPTMQRMLEEFELKMPALTTPFFWFVMVSANIAAPFAFLATLGFLLYWNTPLQRWIHYVLDHVFPGPLTSRSRRSTLQLLAATQLSSQPVVESLKSLAQAHRTPWTRWRLRRAIHRIERGEEAWASLGSERLLSKSHSQCLALLPNNASRRFLLLEVAKLSHLSERKRGYVGMTLLQSCTTLLFAMFVLWACWACFAPLVSLIQGLANAF